MMRRIGVSCLAVACGSLSLSAIHETRSAGKTATHQIQIDHQDKIADFPSSEDQLMVINHPDNPDDMMKMRLHGWKLFLRLTSKAGAPLRKPEWRKWYAKCDLDMTPDCDDPIRGHNTFAGNSPQIGPHSHQADGRLSTVFYSPSAGNDILDRRFELEDAAHLQKILRGQLSGLPAKPASIPAFDHDSIVVKEIWQGFPTGPGQGKNALLHLYDVSNKTIALGDGLNAVSSWTPTNILLKAGDVDTNTSCAASDYKPGDSVPINCFYWRRYSGICKPVMERPTLQNLDTPLDSSCIVALVGVHIATKEIASWTWSTFWWTGRISDSAVTIPEEIQRAKPPSDLAIPAQYSHYAMNTTFGPPSGEARDARFVFNPYLEGPNAGGTQTNCFGCHNNAAYDPRGPVDGDMITQHHSGQGISPSGIELTWASPRAPLTSQQLHKCDLVPGSTTPCRLHTDFLRSIATNQDENTSSPK